MRAYQPEASPLLVPRTFDLAHVKPVNFAAALGKDPVRIFEFVRDYVAYEAYAGNLRGARGTLLAMAGNAVDRSALLASLLQEAGQRVRFVTGSLGERDARELIAGMAASRVGSIPLAGAQTPPNLDAAMVAFTEGVKQDVSLIKDRLKRAGVPIRPAAGSTGDALLSQVRDHYWIQWEKDGRWIDLDPSFADAAPGKSYARVQQTLAALPDDLAHRITITIRLEEYAGATMSTREILRHSVKAADLSGVDLVLTHQPENWKGPAGSIADALGAVFEDTGRIRPVLSLGEQFWLGEAFRARIPQGTGGLSILLSGEGTRKPFTLATAEWLQVELIGPGGHAETIVRKLFDLAGPARRAKGINLTAEEVQARIADPNALDPVQAIYSLFFTTGHLDVAHFAGAGDDSNIMEGDVIDFAALFRRISVVFTATSDRLLTRLVRPQRSVLRLYPDSPRLIIMDYSSGPRARLSLDLRHLPARVLAFGSHPEDTFAANVLKGVVEGTLERSVLEYGLGGGTREAAEFFMSASRLFEEARAANVQLVLLPQEASRMQRSVPEDAWAQLTADTADGFLAIAPDRPLPIAGVPRLAWWRVDPKTGKTTAVTDEGLHQVVVEYRIVDDGKGKTQVIVRRTYIRGSTRITLGQEETTFTNVGKALGYIEKIIAEGGKLTELPFWGI
jgi:hypothetical protein